MQQTSSNAVVRTIRRDRRMILVLSPDVLIFAPENTPNPDSGVDIVEMRGLVPWSPDDDEDGGT